MSPVIGIDLGTTNSCAAFVSNKVPRVVPSEAGFNTMPSILAYEAGTGVLLGEAARAVMQSDPSRALYGVKRLLGRQYSSPVVQELQRRFKYEIIAGSDGDTAMSIAGKTFSCGDVQAEILRQIKRYAEIHLGDEIPDVVIAVPAYYNDHQRNIVKKAGEEAGFRVLRLVNEPTAAALAYGFNRGFDQRILVYDLGGGTFDVSVLELTNNVFQVIASGGDMFLGGADFDACVIEWLDQEFFKANKFHLHDDARAIEKLRVSAERAKIELSLLANTPIRVPEITERKGRHYDLDVMLSRDHLNHLTTGLVERTIVLVDSILQDQGIDKREIDEVILVGGQTRMPLVVDAISAYLGKSPRKGIHPDECVALGAALLGDSLSTIDSVTLLDAISMPISLESENGLAEVVFAQHTQAPNQAKITIATWQDAQTTMQLDVIQGEADTSEYLGTLLVDNLPEGPAGTIKLEVTITLDGEGMLRFEVQHDPDGDSRVIPLTTIERPLVPREKARSGERFEADVPKADAGIKGLFKGILGGRK